MPEQFAGVVRQAQPIAVLIAGQPGAGKTATTTTAKRHLDQRGGAAHICGDFYKPYHPAYDRLLQEDPATAGAYTRLDSRRWHTRAEQHVREQGYDAVVETALADPDETAQVAGAFREAGYEVRVAALAVAEGQSRLGILHRYAAQVAEGVPGRWVAADNHDRCYRGMLESADRIDAERLAGHVEVHRRGGTVLYANTLTPAGQWADPPATRAAIEAERARPWTAAEISQAREQLQIIRRDLAPVWDQHRGETHAVIDLAQVPDATRAELHRDADAVPAGTQPESAPEPRTEPEPGTDAEPAASPATEYPDIEAARTRLTEQADRARELARRLDEASREHQARQARQRDRGSPTDPQRRPDPGPTRSPDHGPEPA